MKWDESKHPRDEIGRFTERDRTPGQKVRYQQLVERYGDGEQSTKPKTYRVDAHTYVIPVGKKVKYGGRNLIFHKNITITGVITIIKPRGLREQVRISQNYGGIFGAWCKKAGNATIEISGEPVEGQIHWYENPDGSIAGEKFIRSK